MRALPDLHGHVVLVTGTTTGIGKETAVGLARAGATVATLCRDGIRGSAALAEIRTRGNSRDVHLFTADLSSLSAVRRVAGEIRAAYPRLHVLVNNAGLFRWRFSETVDGIETTFAVNHLAPFLLTNLLLPVLTPGPSRIVIVASEAHRRTHVHFDDLEGRKAYDGRRAYARSKLENVLFAYALARRLKGTSITANALHPGVIATGIVRDAPAPVRWLWALFARSAAKGAETPLHVAASPEVEGISGRYFDDCRERRSSDVSYDEAAQEKLWDVSARMTGLSAG